MYISQKPSAPVHAAAGARRRMAGVAAPILLSAFALAPTIIWLATPKPETAPGVCPMVSSASAEQQAAPAAREQAKPAAPAPAPQPAAQAAGSDAALERGKALFARQCSVCHGEAGDGEGKFAYLMNPRPRDFRQGKFKLATTENLVPSEADLVRTISRGMPGSAMPPWGHLPNADLAALARFVRQVHIDAVKGELAARVKDGKLTAADADKDLAARTQAGAAIMVPPEPAFDDLHWFRGRRIYLEACSACHGVEGHPVAENVKLDNEGYPVPPRSFVNGIFKGGSESHQLYVRMLKGLPGTPMPGYAGTYSEGELWDMIHYVQSLSRAGAQERAQLRQGTFVAAKVPTLPAGPMEAAWDQARSLYVAMTPLWWSEKRVEGLTVQALHDGKELALRFSWLDPTTDDRAVRFDEFRDAVAVQFSLTSDPPFYMGDRTGQGGVNIWFWKADRQANIAKGYQDVDSAFPNKAVDRYPEQKFVFKDMTAVEPPKGSITEHDSLYVAAWGAGNLAADPNVNTPVECLVAQGPGTLMSKPANVQFVKGAAKYERGVWYVQMQRSMKLPGEHGAADERAFSPGDYLPVSFAIWDGGNGDRDGKKNISIWQKLVIE